MSLQEVPALTVKFWDMTKAYLIQETIDPFRRFGKVSGYSLGAAVAWSSAAVLLAVALQRTIVALLPESPYWEALGYVLTVLILAGVVAALVAVGRRAAEGPLGESL